MLALATIYDGGSRSDAARVGSVTLQIVRDWVLHFNTRGPDGLVNGKAPGGRAKLNDAQRQALAKMLESGPIPAIHGVVRCRRKDLVQWIFQEFRISIDETTVGRELKALGFGKLSARPRHYVQNDLEAAAFKKTSPPLWQKSEPSSRRARTSNCGGPTKRRIGQKNKITRRWVRRGTRPCAPADQRTMWAYIFGAICPKKGSAPASCSSGATPKPCRSTSPKWAVDDGAHAVLILDQAGWHVTPKLKVPDNITLMFLPPRSSELNPVENVWQFMRDNWLSNRIFKDYNDIVALLLRCMEQARRSAVAHHVRQWAHGY